jgi:2-phospho-L-lactate guanylyltransferase
MKVVLIPVKDLGRAKQRLARLFSQAERTRIAWAMLEHVFQQVGGARGVDRIFVVTTYAPAARLAKHLGMEVIGETAQVSESQSVDLASRLCRERGAQSLLRLPIDLPLLRAQDVEIILGRTAPPPSALFVASRDGRGTNALMRTPPDLFPSHFGPDSLVRHLQEAARVGASTQVIEIPSLAFDLDDASDLEFFLAQGQGTELFDLLHELDATHRLRAIETHA